MTKQPPKYKMVSLKPEQVEYLEKLLNKALRESEDENSVFRSVEILKKLKGREG